MSLLRVLSTEPEPGPGEVVVNWLYGALRVACLCGVSPYLKSLFQSVKKVSFLSFSVLKMGYTYLFNLFSYKSSTLSLCLSKLCFSFSRRPVRHQCETCLPFKQL